MKIVGVGGGAIYID